MRYKLSVLLLAMCLLLAGCTNWMDGSYSSVHPHTERDQHAMNQTASVGNYEELREALVDMVEDNVDTMLLNVAQMDLELLPDDMEQAVDHVLTVNPIGAYAVENITYEHGTSGGQNALSVTVTYNHNRSEIRSMKHARDMNEVRSIVADTMEQCESRVVLLTKEYETTDISQFVSSYADENPNVIMETPQVTVNMYPEEGPERILEIVFSYQSNRDSLRSMQSRVRPLFTSAELYVTGNQSDYEKYDQLYSFLMERHEYQLKTSITPSYSLLIHGVGDSKAFAAVYAAMCRQAGVECQVVSGTLDGEPMFWNMIRDGELYRHVDLLRCSADGYFHPCTDDEMAGYVWDYSAYPQCKPPESLDTYQE